MSYLKNFKCYIKGLPKLLYVIVFLGTIVRLTGIWYGLPLALNVDEPSIVSTAFRLRHSLNPERFDWPHLYFYINAFFYGLFTITRNFLNIFFDLPDVLFTVTPFFVISRLVTVMFGVLSILAIFYLASIVFRNKYISLLSALLLAILPVHVYESHWAKLDVVQTFFVIIALVFIYNVYLNAKRKDFILAGVFIGISTSIKYNGFLLFFVLLVAFLLHYKRDYKKWFSKYNIFNFVYAGITSIILFLIGTPYALFDHELFLSNEYGKGVLWQFQNVGKVSFAQYPFELYETFFEMYKTDLGFFLWIIFLLILILFLFFNKRDDKTTLFILPVLVFSFYISSFKRSPSHYFLFLSPMYIIIISAFIYNIGHRIRLKLLEKSISKSVVNLILALFLFFMLFPSLIITFKNDLYMSRKDTRVIAFNWVKNNLPDTKNSDFLYVMGEDLEQVPFRKNETKRIKRVDSDNLRGEGFPAYLIIGVEGVYPDELFSKKMDSDNLEGDAEQVLKHSELELYVNDSNRFGPPIYIYKVFDVDQDK